MAAAVRGDVEAMRLLSTRRREVNAKNGAGETALIVWQRATVIPPPCSCCSIAARDAMCRTNATKRRWAMRALPGNEETVNLLLDHGAEVNVRNIRGYSPLMLAASSDAVPAGVVKLLLAKARTRLHGRLRRNRARPRGQARRHRSDAPARRRSERRGSADRRRIRRLEHRTPSRSGRASADRWSKKQSHNFIRIGGCNSCHSQDLPSAAAGLRARAGD